MTWQPVAALPTDIELWATDYLRGELLERPEHYADAFVSNRVPTKRRPQMVIVRRDGGFVANLRDTARLNVRCWADDEGDAIDLARLVTALLLRAPNGSPVLRVTQSSAVIPVADESGQALRMCIFEIQTRAEVLT